MEALTALAELNPTSAAALRIAKKVALSKEAAAAAKVFKTLKNSKKKRDKYLSQRRSQIGEAPGSSLTKRNQFRTDGFVSYSTNVLHATQLVQIPRMTTTFALNSRLRDVVFVSGIKVCLTVRSLVSSSNQLYFNLAVVAAKNRGDIDGVDFFRDYSGDARQQDFNNATLSAMDRHCLPINVDELTVLRHDRYIIHGSTDAACCGKVKPKTYSYEFYVPIKRQIRFEGTGPDSETRFALCHWTGLVGDSISASQTPVANQYQIEYKAVTFYKEPMPKLEFR